MSAWDSLTILTNVYSAPLPAAPRLRRHAASHVRNASTAHAPTRVILVFIVQTDPFAILLLRMITITFAAEQFYSNQCFRLLSALSVLQKLFGGYYVQTYFIECLECQIHSVPIITQEGTLIEFLVSSTLFIICAQLDSRPQIFVFVGTS